MAIYGTSFSKFKVIGDSVINGGFDTDTDWSKQTGWSIGSGVASCDGSQPGLSGCYQAGVLTINLFVRLTYTLTISAGTLTPTQSSGTLFTARSVGGTYVEEKLITGVSSILNMRGNADFIGTIDNVSVEEVIKLNYSIIKPNWKIPQVIEHQSILTGGINYIHVAGDKASFDVICNIWKNDNPKATMQTILLHNHTVVKFMPHEDQGDFLTIDSVIEADFYISMMKPFYVKNNPPILQDKLFIRFESLGSIFMPEVIPPLLVDEDSNFLIDEEGDKLIKEL